MKAHELLTLAKPMIEALSKVGVNAKDVQYLDMYKDYIRLKSEGLKITYIEAYLNTEYNVSIRNIKYIVKRMQSKV